MFWLQAYLYCQFDFAHDVRHDLERLNVQKMAKRGLNTSDKRTLNIYTWTVNTSIKNLLPLTHDIYSVSLMCNLWHFYKLLGEIWDKTLRYKSLETSWVIKLLKGDHKLWYVLIFLLLIQFCYYLLQWWNTTRLGWCTSQVIYTRHKGIQMCLYKD